MKLESQKITINQNPESIFPELQNIKNYEKWMPEDTKSFRVNDEKCGFRVRIGALPEVGMDLNEIIEFSEINFISPSKNFDYKLNIHLNELGENQTEIFISFDGKFNPMIEMIAKKPLQNFINTIVSKFENQIS